MRRPAGLTRVAAIDCGTNSIRLLVADVSRAGLLDVARRMEIVRLGEGVDRTGEFSREAIDRTRRVLAEYASELRDLGARRVRMVATSASRDVAGTHLAPRLASLDAHSTSPHLAPRLASLDGHSTSRERFRAMVVETLGAEPEVITGDEEARLSFLGATRELVGVQSPYLVVDIGGGSTEFVLGKSTVERAASVDIGCVRLTERHLHSDPPTAAEVDAAVGDIRAGIALAAEIVPMARARTLVGLAGSVTTVAALALGLPAYDPDRIHHARIGYDQVAEVTAMLLRTTRRERAALPVMHPGRADVIGAGALVLRTVMQLTGIDSVLASEHDILDGIAYSLG